jgi:hypothetical protein
MYLPYMNIWFILVSEVGALSDRLVVFLIGLTSFVVTC